MSGFSMIFSLSLPVELHPARAATGSIIAHILKKVLFITS
jgi:hypothetical protein